MNGILLLGTSWNVFFSEVKVTSYISLTNSLLGDLIAIQGWKNMGF